MFALKQEFGRLLQKKKEFLARQRRGSLLMEPVVITDEHPMRESVLSFEISLNLFTTATWAGIKKSTKRVDRHGRRRKQTRQSNQNVLFRKGDYYRFAVFYRKVSNAPMNKEEHPAQLKLIEQVIQE